ncbi:hypothetical protein KDD93_03935 [Campylobacter sp. faydin G-24]|uniref:AsmA family protein n=1 Tax=Campylobacter anatolicus TaxID=2829105 RepID=A0ABS5HHK2_9BACT|nr:hypothetical protein [Campylobacter anatolicus]MBR8463725.1 hypothetical protein [Campylobacter anatolicus]
MKKIIYILVALLIVLGFAIGLIFTSSGNAMIANLLQNKAKENGVELSFSKFMLGLNSIDTVAIINGEITVNLNGKFSIFSQNLNLNYNILANNLKSANLNLKNPINLNGTIVGKLNDLNIKGAGTALGSNADFNVNLKEYKPLILNINAKKLNLSEALVLANQPNYANALLDITANINENNGKPNGIAEILLYDGTLNSNLIAKKHNISLSKDLKFKSAINVDINGDMVNAKSMLLSEILNLKTTSSTYNIAKNELTSDFDVDVQNLANLQSIIGQKLNGSIKAKGKISMKNNKLDSLNTDINTLSGVIKASLNGEKLNATFDKISLTQILKMIDQPIYANADINGVVAFDSLTNLKGKVKLKTQNGKLNAAELKKSANIELDKDEKFDLDTDISLAKNVADFRANLATELMNLNDIKGSFDITNSELKLTTNVNVDKLKKLAPITKMQLNGKLNADITVNKNDKTLNAQIISNSLAEGKLNATLNNGNLTANLSGFTFKGLSALLGLEHIYDGLGDAKLSYDTTAQKGIFNVGINEGKLVASQLTNTIKMLSGRDITTEIYKNGEVAGEIDKSLINFNAKMSAKRSDINVTKGIFDTATGAINIPVDFRYEKTDAKINITGTNKAPKYSVSSDYLRGKAEKEIDKFLDRQLGKNNNSSNDTKDVVKGLLRSLF